MLIVFMHSVDEYVYLKSLQVILSAYAKAVII